MLPGVGGDEEPLRTCEGKGAGRDYTKQERIDRGLKMDVTRSKNVVKNDTPKTHIKRA
jgi:hypothetical protein